MIQLTESDKVMILICKMNLQEKYPIKDSIPEKFIPYWIEYYAWDPMTDNNYEDYLNGLFFRMYEVYKKIKDDQSGTDLEMRNLFSALMYKGISNDSEKPILRGINHLHGLIQFTQVVTDDVKRFSLTLKEE